MRILPVYPKFPVSFWSFKYAVEMLGKKSSMPPLGLATVAAMLPGDIEVQRIIDMNVEPLTDEQIGDADILITSSMIVQRNSLEDVINRAHAHGKKVIAGGPYPTSYHGEITADHFVLGEAESIMPKLIEDLKGGRLQRIYAPYHHSPKPSITETPIPRWDLLKMQNYVAMVIQYSRGCPYDCEFCDITALFGRSSRTKSPEQMTGELDALHHVGWKGSVFIVDDNFIGNKNHVRQLLPELINWQKQKKYPFQFYTEASMELASPNHTDILEGMAEAGFDMVFTGIESVDPEVIKKMNKGQNLGRQTPHEKVETLQKAGLEVTAGFIIGSDGEKREVFNNLFNFIQESGIIIPMVGLLTAVKGTRLYERLQREGRLRTETSGNNTHHLGFNFQPELEEEFLIRNYTDLLDKLFEPGNFYQRCQVLYERRKDHPTLAVNHRVDKHSLQAFAKIVYQNVVREPSLDFVKYMAKTALIAPKNLPEAITYAVKLHHFRKMTQGTQAIMNYQDETKGWYSSFQEEVSRFKGNAKERLAHIQSIEEGLLRKARVNYERINEDFRHDAQEAFEWLRTSLEQKRLTYLNLF